MTDRLSQSEQSGCRWWFPRHRWAEVSRKVVRGAQEQGRQFKFGGGNWSEAASDMLYGYTLIEQRCKSCGRVRVEKFTGAVGDCRS